MIGTGLLLEIHARENLGVTEDQWKPYLWECLPFGQPTQVIKLKGGKLVTGPRGGRKWVDEKTVYLNPKDHDEWTLRWAGQSGKCYECMGEGKTVSKITAGGVTEYRECRVCGGDGKYHPAVPE
jgi:hypothetical protein